MSANPRQMGLKTDDDDDDDDVFLKKEIKKYHYAYLITQFELNENLLLHELAPIE